MAVVGPDYVGLPLSLCACEAGFRVVGFDINPERVEQLNKERSPLHHIGEAKIAAVRREERLAAISDPASSWRRMLL